MVKRGNQSGTAQRAGGSANTEIGLLLGLTGRLLAGPLADVADDPRGIGLVGQKRG